MSTIKGVIAYKTDIGWKGVYHSNQSNPAALGKDIFEFVQKFKQQGKTTKEAIQYVIDEWINAVPQGWSKFPNVLHNVPEADMRCSSENPNPLYLQYVYILDPDTETMTILGNRGVEAENYKLFKDSPIAIKGTNHDYENTRWDYGHCIFWHRAKPLAIVDLNEDKFPVVRNRTYKGKALRDDQRIPIN